MASPVRVIMVILFYGLLIADVMYILFDDMGILNFQFCTSIETRLKRSKEFLSILDTPDAKAILFLIIAPGYAAAIA